MKAFRYSILLLVMAMGSMQVQAADDVQECKRLFDEALYDQAQSVCLKAAKSGDAASQTMLGEIYDDKGDSKNTRHWWSRAASSGYQPARNLMAMKHYYGGTVFGPEKDWPQDYASAFGIWQADARRGHAPSQFMVGVMYHKGQGVKTDLAESWFWLKLALSNGYKLATDVLIEVAREITPEQKRHGMKKLEEFQKSVGI